MKTRLVRRYVIHHGAGGTASQKLFSWELARRLVRRAQRMGLDVYIAGSLRVRVGVTDATA